MTLTSITLVAGTFLFIFVLYTFFRTWQQVYASLGTEVGDVRIGRICAYGHVPCLSSFALPCSGKSLQLAGGSNFSSFRVVR